MQIKYWEIHGLSYRVGVSVGDLWFDFDEHGYELSAFSKKNWTESVYYNTVEISEKRMLLICDQPIFTEEIYKKCLTKNK